MGKRRSKAKIPPTPQNYYKINLHKFLEFVLALFDLKEQNTITEQEPKQLFNAPLTCW